MKTIFFLLLSIGLLQAQDMNSITVIFASEHDTSSVDTFYFHIKKDFTDCTQITSSDFREDVVKNDQDDYLPIHIVWYDQQGITAYIDYTGDFDCWSTILYDKKRLYLSVNKYSNDTITSGD